MSRLINFYSQVKKETRPNPGYDSHGIEVPFRMLCCCASGSGKTNYILNLLYELTDTFHKVVIITKAEEPLYSMLQDRLENISIFYEGNIPEFEALDKKQNGLIIFDDMVLTPDKKIGEIFIRGRKLHYSSIYISQSFFQTPKIIRQNVNYVALGRGINKRDLKMILSEYSIGLSVDELSKIYFDLTKTHMHFMLIDLMQRKIKHNIKETVREL